MLKNQNSGQLSIDIKPGVLITSKPDHQKERFGLRDYQIEAKRNIYKFWRGTPEAKKRDCKNSVLLVAPTGSGKTVIAASIMEDAAKKGKRVLFAVHLTKLVGQTQKTLLAKGIKSGIIWQGDSTDPDAPVQIAMIQSLSPKRFPKDIDLVIFDECHSSVYWKISQDIIKHYSGGILPLSKAKFLGLTATPWRLKAKEGFCQFFECIVEAVSTAELIKRKQLTQPRYFGWAGIYDWSKLEATGGDFTARSMKEQLGSSYNSDIIKHGLPLISKNDKAIAFCASVEQAKNLDKQFNDKGIKSKCVVGSIQEQERDAIYQSLKKGEIQVITSVGCLCEGFDETSVTVCILARPTKSIALLKQMIGRALRIHPGKEFAKILDFGGSCQRLQRAEDYTPISLCPNDRKTKPAEPVTKECPQCNALVHAAYRICPECGFEFPPPEPKDKDFFPVKNFGELPEPEILAQIKYVRKTIRTRYNAGMKALANGKRLTVAHDISRAKTLFHEKFKKTAPDDWFLGAIYGEGIRIESNKNKLRNYLETYGKQTGFSGEKFIDYMISLEFGKPGKEYFSSSGEKYVATWEKGKTKWWEVLGCAADSSWSFIKQIYLQLVKANHPDLATPENQDRANQALKAINNAFDQAKLERE